MGAPAAGFRKIGVPPMDAPIICKPVEKTPTRKVAIAAARKRTLVAITGEALLLKTRPTFDLL